MKYLFYILIFTSLNAFGQSFNYSYIDPCTGITKTINIPSNGITVTYYGQINTFQANDFYSGAFENWAQGVYASFGSNNPCASVVGLPTGLTVAQSSALNFLGIINSLDAIKDLAGGGTNFLSGTIESTKKSEKKEKKDDNTPNSTGTGGATDPAQNGNSTGQNTPANQSQNSGTGNSQGQTGNSNQPVGGGQSGGQPVTGTTGAGSNQSNGSAQNSSATGQPKSTSQTGSTQVKKTETSNSTGSGQPSETGATSGQTSGGSATGQTAGSSAGGNTTAQNGSNSGGGTQGGGQNAESKGGVTSPASTDQKTDQAGEGKTDLVGSSVNNVQRVDAKNGNRPNIIASSDLVGFNFKNSDVSYGGKFTGGYTSARWDGARAHGLLVDYTTALKGPNISGFYAFIKPKRIDLISTTLTLGLDIKKSAYATLALGQMWDINKRKNVKAVYLLTGSYGRVYEQPFVGTAAIAGAMWDLKLGKRVDLKLMGLYVYAPFVSYYNDILLKSPHVVLPIAGMNLKVTKKFKININAGGAWAIKQNTLNYTVMMGTRLLL